MQRNGRNASKSQFFSQIPRMTRRRSLQSFAYLFASGVGLSALTAACGSVDSASSGSTGESSGAVASADSASGNSPASASNQIVRIGYQKSATALNLLKTQGQLDQRLSDAGGGVEWNEFAAGPQMLEALNVGSIDFAYTGETPPVFAQAAGAPLLYVAYEPLGPAAEAILVKADSPLQTVADLKGKRVALNKGSNVHYLLVRALETAGLAYTDIETVFLPPGDARPAFELGSVDAWVIWDPFQAAAETDIGARILADGKDLVENRGFFLSTQSFVAENPDLLQQVLTELRDVSDWAKQNPNDVTTFLSQELGIDKKALDLAEKRRGYGVQPISDEVVAGQQRIADAFYDLQLIPQAIDISTAVWRS